MADKEIAFRQPPGDRWKVEGSDAVSNTQHRAH